VRNPEEQRWFWTVWSYSESFDDEEDAFAAVSAKIKEYAKRAGGQIVVANSNSYGAPHRLRRLREEKSAAA
jgi:hypothetical protein